MKSQDSPLCPQALRLFKPRHRQQGLLPRCSPTLSALFGYRNRNFPNGLEWPVAEREAFVRRVAQEHWDSWFRCARSDNNAGYT